MLHPPKGPRASNVSVIHQTGECQHDLHKSKTVESRTMPSPFSGQCRPCDWSTALYQQPTYSLEQALRARCGLEALARLRVAATAAARALEPAPHASNSRSGPGPTPTVEATRSSLLLQSLALPA